MRMVMGESAVPLGILSGEAIEPEEERMLRFNPDVDRCIRTIDRSRNVESGLVGDRLGRAA